MFSNAITNYFVRPAKWKKYFNLIKTEKEASRSKAIEIFPYISSNYQKKRLNKADAILIASFFSNTYQFNRIIHFNLRRQIDDTF